ncbi:MAG: S-layer homology domain-containing protein, partial [Acidimicrobiia bacterium]
MALLVAGTVALTPAGGLALDPGGTFQDDNGSVHEATIEAIAAAGITYGCNPPVDDRFCPTRPVTRAEMASFLVRALDLPAAGSAGFTDTTDSLHAASIDAIAAAGITYGCNPPDNDRYCPDQAVTREQMASFLVRVLHLPASGDAGFVDTTGSVHAADIDAIAAAGITYGCNPPDNDRYCPRDAVTREQMASFLSRGLHLDPIVPPPPLPAVSPSTYVHIGTDNWLYLRDTIDEACFPTSVYDRVAEELAKVEAVVTASG